MRRVLVREFGGPEKLEMVEEPTPQPGPGEVLVEICSIGLNHADLLARAGKYKLASGDAPFTPGLEGGGRIAAVGDGVTALAAGDRVSLGVDVPRVGVGTYRTHFLLPADKAIAVPDAVPDAWLGAMWLPYLTAWGCLVWRQDLQPGQSVLIPAASSSVGLAAAQVAKACGAIAIGTTTSPGKVDTLKTMAEAPFDHVVLTRDNDWYREVRDIVGAAGVDVFFDPVASGDFLQTEIRLMAKGATLWVYGLLGTPDTVDVSPLIRKDGAIRGWWLTWLAQADEATKQRGYQHVLERLADGTYTLVVADTFPLDDVRRAHREMARGEHLGKLVLVA